VFAQSGLALWPEFRVQASTTSVGDPVQSACFEFFHPTGWGYSRKLGELRKLNIRAVSRNERTGRRSHELV
jgi:hypothetical protein